MSTRRTRETRPSFGAGLSPTDLFFAHGGDLFRIKRLRVESAAGDDWDSGLHRDLTQEVDVASHVRMPRVDNAGDTLAFDFGDFGRHQIHAAHDVRACGRPAATRRERRQT